MSRPIVRTNLHSVVPSSLVAPTSVPRIPPGSVAAWEEHAPSQAHHLSHLQGTMHNYLMNGGRGGIEPMQREIPVYRSIDDTNSHGPHDEQYEPWRSSGRYQYGDGWRGHVLPEYVGRQDPADLPSNSHTVVGCIRANGRRVYPSAISDRAWFRNERFEGKRLFNQLMRWAKGAGEDPLAIAEHGYYVIENALVYQLFKGALETINARGSLDDYAHIAARIERFLIDQNDFRLAREATLLRKYIEANL